MKMTVGTLGFVPPPPTRDIDWNDPKVRARQEITYNREMGYDGTLKIVGYARDPKVVGTALVAVEYKNTRWAFLVENGNQIVDDGILIQDFDRNGGTYFEVKS